MQRYLGWGQVPMTVHVASASGRTLMLDVVRSHAVNVSDYCRLLRALFGRVGLSMAHRLSPAAWCA